ncbi:MAG: hypothetical protein CMF42_03375 [Legionellales bacterium]|nr:hypothetical protein [Legionellales bacterium]|tara:strand:- start:2632 stop:3396 length:765 start_codon:yes stop_codon:yes gene_type:complete
MRTTRPIALITGASSGIGASFAKALAEQGYDLILIARRIKQLDQLKKNLSCQTTLIACDLNDPEAIQSMIKRILIRKPQLFVANAGMGLQSSFENSKWDPINQQIQVMVTAHVMITHALVPQMLKTGGQIIFVNSIAGLVTSAFPPYGAIKSMLHRFALDLHTRYGHRGIQVMSLCPGLTKTEFHQKMKAQYQFDQIPKWLWMNSECVVKKALYDFKRRRVISIPGWYNRIFYRFAQNFPIRWCLTLLPIFKPR